MWNNMKVNKEWWPSQFSSESISCPLYISYLLFSWFSGSSIDFWFWSPLLQEADFDESNSEVIRHFRSEWFVLCLWKESPFHLPSFLRNLPVLLSSQLQMVSSRQLFCWMHVYSHKGGLLLKGISGCRSQEKSFCSFQWLQQ